MRAEAPHARAAISVLTGKQTLLGAVKVLHFCSIALWMGGAAALLPLLATVDFADPDQAHRTYLALRGIAWNVIGWGGIGTVTTGLLLAGLSPWGFFRYRWIAAKLAMGPAMVLFGMFFVERHMLVNLAHMEEDGGSSALLVATQVKVQFGVVGLLTAFVLVIALSVAKPWGRWGRQEDVGGATQTVHR